MSKWSVFQNTVTFVVSSPSARLFSWMYTDFEKFLWFVLDPQNPPKLAPHENYHLYCNNIFEYFDICQLKCFSHHMMLTKWLCMAKRSAVL